MRVLVVNAGSSSLKLRLLDGHDRTAAERELAAPRAVVDENQLRAALQDGLGDADAVGHRIVHGGERFVAPVVVDATVEEGLRDLSDLAPLHQPKSLAALDVGTLGAPVRTLVITAREDLQIAREVRGLLSGDRMPVDR